LASQKTQIRLRAQFEATAFEHMEALYRTALRMTRDPKNAEDLVQEAYLRAFKNYHQFEQGSNFKAWIFTILTNIFINNYRKKARRPGEVDFGAVEDVYAAGEKEPQHLRLQDLDRIQERLSDEVKSAVDRLPEEYRLVFLLAVLEELSYKEIAEIAGIPIGTVMSRLFRARQQLQRELREFAQKQGVIRTRGTADAV